MRQRTTLPTLSAYDIADRIIDGLHAHKGASVNERDLRPGHTGYMVSRDGWEARLQRRLLACMGEAALRDWIATYAASVLQDDVYDDHLDFVGAWLSPDGDLCLDVSRRFSDIDKAMIAAMNDRQEAIYDLEAGDSIPVDC